MEADKLTGSQRWALSIIARDDGIQVSGLARAMALHQSTASNVAEQLFSAGLIRKERSPLDGRRSFLHVTDVGLAYVAEAAPKVGDLLLQALANLPFSSLRDLHTSLGALIDQMQVSARSNMEPSEKE